MIYDCHAHLVSDDFDRYPPSPLSGTLDRKLDDPMTAERLLREMDENNIERAVVVQRAHVYGYNNEYVVDSAARYSDRLRAVVCVDPQAGTGPERVRHWIKECGAVGIRLTEPFKGADTGWLNSPEAIETWKTAVELGASICLHMYRWNRVESLVALKQVMDKFPESVVVLDHLSNIIPEQGAPDYGVDEPLLDLVQFPNVFLKLTTINLGRMANEKIDPQPVIARTLQSFGASRFMWGSDVAQSAGSYADLIKMGVDATAFLSENDRQQVLYETTNRVYGGAQA